MIYSLVTKWSLPEVGRVRFRDPEVVSGEAAVGEDGLDLTEHVAEDEAEFGQISSMLRRFLEHLLLPIFEEFDGLNSK